MGEGSEGHVSPLGMQSQGPKSTGEGCVTQAGSNPTPPPQQHTGACELERVK